MSDVAARGSGRKLQDENQVKGRYGEMLAAFAFPQEWVVRPIPDDFGLDLAVEIFHEVDSRADGTRRYQTRGEHVYLQVKTTDSLKVKRLTRQNGNDLDVAKFSMKTADLQLVERMGAGTPVVLVLVDRSMKGIFYLCLTDYISHFLKDHKPDWRAQDEVMVYVPLRNTLVASDGSEPIEDHWNYFSRLAFRSRLYSAFNVINYCVTELEHAQPNLEGNAETDIEATLEFLLKLTQTIDEIKALDIWPEPGEKVWALLHTYAERLRELEAWSEDFQRRLKSATPGERTIVESMHWEPMHNMEILRSLNALGKTFHSVGRSERLPIMDPFNDSDMANYA